MLRKLTRCQEILRIARGFAVVLAAAVGAALGQKPRREERQDRGDLVERHAPSPVRNRNIDPLLHHQRPGLAIDQTRLQPQHREALECNRQVFGRNLHPVANTTELMRGNERGAGA